MATPDHTVRRSAKAKNIRLKVTPQDGLVVVLPSQFDERKLPAILKRKQGWIAEALAIAERTRRFLEPRPITHLPDCLDLQALHENWHVSYQTLPDARGVMLRANGKHLEFGGSKFSRAKVVARLKAWLRRRVREELAGLAADIAQKKRFELRKVLVKNQRTRWASCSAKRNLSLNIKLLFIPAELVRYVIIHELCHSVHLNHSPEFWRLVQTHEPRFRALDQQLRDAWKCVPQWLF